MEHESERLAFLLLTSIVLAYKINKMDVILYFIII